MSQSHRIRLRWHVLLTLLGVAGLLVVVVLNVHLFKEFSHVVKNVNWYMLGLLVVVLLLGYYLNALYYQSILRVFGYQLPWPRLLQGALAANFVNYVVPSAGLAGAGFLSQVLSPEVPRGEGVLTQFVRYAFSSLAALLLVPIGFLVLLMTRSHAAGLRVTEFSIAVTAVSLALAVALIFLIQHETLMKRAAHWTGGKLEKLTKSLHQKTIDGFIDDFYIGYRLMAQRKKALIVPILWSVTYILLGVLTVYISFLAFGKVVNLGVVMVGYLLANVVSVVGGAFFSSGVFTLGMVGMFVALGQSFAIALSVTIVYRTINLVVGLPPGFYYYRKYLP